MVVPTAPPKRIVTVAISASLTSLRPVSQRNTKEVRAVAPTTRR